MKTAIDILNKYFHFSSFYKTQELVINRILNENKHTLVLMPTGGGKSLCYQIPAMLFDGGTIVISPLIALMQDQVDALKSKNIPANFINSTVSKEKKQKRLDAFIEGKIKLLYVTPERFRKKDFIDKIKNAKISLLAVDEAHCISEWGQDFRPDYSRIGVFREIIGNPLTIALTATATPIVQQDIISKLRINNNDIKIFHSGIERPNLKLEAIDVYDEKETLNAIFSILDNYKGSGIIYFSLIKKLEYYSQKLSDSGYNHSIYHGKLSPKEREKVQRNFLSDQQQLILATNAFGMGIDKSNIRYVIHAEIPSSLESYYQEIGRAGRDGLDSLCTLLYNQNDLYTQMEFIKWANPDADYYYSIYNMIKNNNQAVNAYGIDFIREQISFKDKNDFRVETVLAMLDRYSITEGNILNKNLVIVDDLPIELQDSELLKNKLMNDNKKLLSVVNYFRTEKCRKVEIHNYFGFKDTQSCGICDNCKT